MSTTSSTTQVRGDVVSGREKAGVCICAFCSTGTLLVSHTAEEARRCPVSVQESDSSLLNCLITLEETPHSADALCEDKWWVVSSSCSGWTTSPADAVLGDDESCAALVAQPAPKCGQKNPPKLGRTLVGELWCHSTSEKQHLSPGASEMLQPPQSPPAWRGLLSAAAHCGFHPRAPNRALQHLTPSRLTSRCHHN